MKMRDNKERLLEAIKDDAVDKIEALINSGADIETRYRDGSTPLIAAIICKHIRSVRRLLDLGANIEVKRDDGATPLIAAVYLGYIEIVALLLQEGADALMSDKRGHNALFYATSRGESEIEKLLGSKGEFYIQKPNDNIAGLDTMLSEKALSKFDNIIGLESVKKNIQNIVNNIKIEYLRNPDKKVQAGHYIFQGNPGTGKTTIANIMDDVFKEMGILEKSHLIEVTREDLVAEYVGGTAVKTKKVLQEALGGILFIDEAYSLARGEDDSFGQEAIDTIVPFMEKHRGDFVLIVAGYTEDMQLFLDANTGFKSRFTHTIDFEDYTKEEMLEIFNLFVDKAGLRLDEGVAHALKQLFDGLKDESEHFGNGRDARKVFNAVLTRLNSRLVPFINEFKHKKDERLYTITLDDIPANYAHFLSEHKSEEALQKAFSKLDEIVGLEAVKENIRDIIAQIKLAQRRKKEDAITAGHYIFQGNPGTGKTTIANLMDDIFKAMGILKKGHLVEVTREDLVASYVGQTATKTKEVLQSALGGILFIDEAYALSRGGQNDFGQEAIDTIVPFMEKHRDEFVLIVAGYTDEMKGFLDANTGLKSRFTHTINFPDYSSEEMLKIFKIFVKSEGYTLDQKADKALVTLFSDIKKRDEHFANAREVRKVFEISCKNMDKRLSLDESIVGEALNHILVEDIQE